MNDIEKKLHVREVTVDCVKAALKDDSTNVNQTGGFLEPRVDKLLQVKAHMSTLKNAWVSSQTKLWFANNLEQESLSADVEENWLSCEDHAHEQDLMSKEKKEAENVKNDIDSVEEALEKHAELIQTSNEAIKAQRLQIQNKLTILNEKMKKLKKLHERKQLLESQKRERASSCGMAYSKENTKQKLEQTGGALEQCSAAVNSLREHTSVLESERDSNNEFLLNMDEKLSVLSTEQEKLLKSEEQERLDFLSKTLATSGFRVLNVGENWMEVEIADIYDGGADMSTLVLTVHFAEGDGNEVTIRDITANCSTVLVKDLIAHLTSNSELNLFNFEIQKRFHNHVKLMKEIELLQKRFAIDWNEDERVVRLMLGKAGQIFCTLKVQSDYPNNGDVTVVEIHGADPAIIFQDNLVTRELTTLTSWIEYLDIKYSSMLSS